MFRTARLDCMSSREEQKTIFRLHDLSPTRAALLICLKYLSAKWIFIHLRHNNGIQMQIGMKFSRMNNKLVERAGTFPVKNNEL